MNILLTGGSGRLGTELRKLRTYEYVPTHAEMDITNYMSVLDYMLPRMDGIDLIVHAAAYTNTAQAEKDREACWAVNVEGTKHLARYRLPILYLSTEYVFDGEEGLYDEKAIPNPKNIYALTKLIGEQQAGPFAKILRCIFKPRPWPFEMAYDDQWTSGDYVDTIAAQINIAITLFDKLPRIIHVGTGRKTMYDLAKQTRDVLPNSISHAPLALPRDCSLDLAAWTHLKMENSLS